MWFNKNKVEEPTQDQAPRIDTSNTKGMASRPKNWYEDQYQSLTVQRNLFFIITMVCIISIGFSVLVVGQISGQKTIEPMVVQVEDKTGITSIVNPAKDSAWTESEAINQYFLIQYLKARETYNVTSYDYNYNTVVRLLSSVEVYNAFKTKLTDPAHNPLAKYGSTNSTKLEIRAMEDLSNTFGKKGKRIWFYIQEENGEGKKYNKIADILWGFVEMDLNINDKLVNPLGFQIASYSVVDDDINIK